MTGPSFTTEPISNRGLLQWIVVLQLAILVGLLVVYLQFDGLPDKVVERVPTGPDPAGELFNLQQSVDQLSTKVSLILEAVHQAPTAAPSAAP